MPYRKTIMLGGSAFLAVLVVAPRTVEAPRADAQPSAEQVEAAAGYAASEAGLPAGR